MQHSASFRARLKRLRLSVSDLARLSSLDRATVHRALSGGADVLVSTVAKIESALTEEEQRVVRAILDERSTRLAPPASRAVSS